MATMQKLISPHQEERQLPHQPPPLPPSQAQAQAPHPSPWVPSSVRRNCDYCVKKKVKCTGNTSGAGCTICVRKGIKCEYSVKKKPGPKCRKREDEEGGSDEAGVIPATALGMIGTPGQSLSPTHRGAGAGGPAVTVTPNEVMQRFSFLNGAGRSGSFDTADSGGSGEYCGNDFPTLKSSPSSQHLLTPSKKAKPTHDKGTRAARRQEEEEHKQQQLLLHNQMQQQQQQPAVASPWRWDVGEVSGGTGVYGSGQQLHMTQDESQHMGCSPIAMPIPGNSPLGDSTGNGSLHAGGGAPVTPPSLRGLSPPSSATGRFSTIPDDSIEVCLERSGSGGGGAGSFYGVRRPSLSGPSLVGAGGGRAGSLAGFGSMNGGSFVDGLLAAVGLDDKSQVDTLFDQLMAPLGSDLVDYSDVSDASTNVSEISDDENNRTGANQGERTSSSHRRRIKREHGNNQEGTGALSQGSPGSGTGSPTLANTNGQLAAAYVRDGRAESDGSDTSWGANSGGGATEAQKTERQQQEQQQLRRRQRWQQHLQQQQQVQLLQMQKMQQSRPPPESSSMTCSSHHQAHGHHAHRKRAPQADSSDSLPTAVAASSPRTQPNDQQQSSHQFQLQPRRPPPMPRPDSSVNPWRGLLATPSAVSEHFGGAAGVGGASPIAPPPPQPNVGFGGGDGARGGGGGGAHSTHPHRSASPPGGVPRENGGDGGPDGVHSVPQSGGGSRVGAGGGFGHDRNSPWSERVASAAGIGGEATGVDAGPFIQNIGGLVGCVGPVALHPDANNHARSYSYGLGDWLPATETTLDEDLDFLAGMSDVAPLQINAGPDHHAF